MDETGRIGTAQARSDLGAKPLLRLAEVAELLVIGRTTAYEWARNGRLPVVHRQGGMYVPRAALRALLAAEAEAALESLDGEKGVTPAA